MNGGIAPIVLGMFWITLQIAAIAAIVWAGWRYFDRRYKSGDPEENSAKLLSGSFEPTSEVFVDPKDGHTYRVYYNRKTGEREYVRERKAD